MNESTNGKRLFLSITSFEPDLVLRDKKETIPAVSNEGGHRREYLGLGCPRDRKQSHRTANGHEVSRSKGSVNLIIVPRARGGEQRRVERMMREQHAGRQKDGLRETTWTEKALTHQW